MPKQFDYTKVLTIAESKNFSEYDSEEEFEKGDDGQYEESIYAQLCADQTILSILSFLNDRQKIVFMFQLLREAGYGLTHEDCAKTLSMQRVNYMFSLKRVRQKVAKIIKDENKIPKSTK